MEVLQHGLPDRRSDHPEGHRAARRRGDHPAGHRPHRPAPHVLPRPGRHDGARAPPARLLHRGARRPTAGRHRAGHVLGLDGRALVSTNSDLNRFFRALLGGELLAPAQLAQMQVTVPAEYMGPGGRYGLGLASRPLSCGGVYWGHGGTLPGYVTRGGVTEDGRAADIAVTTLPSADVKQRVADAVDAALCR
ncbi:serine hydrolase [Kitasatospora sp. NPDC088160]|uniref:serine hydrolase n=1 Tax=Kitasatospora sp. NPDC088160 TaxID=3364072 RepID=UPI00380CBDE2